MNALNGKILFTDTYWFQAGFDGARSTLKAVYFAQKIGHIGFSECLLVGIHSAGKVRTGHILHLHVRISSVVKSRSVWYFVESRSICLQESHAIAKVTARCALPSALKILGSPRVYRCPEVIFRTIQTYPFLRGVGR